MELTKCIARHEGGPHKARNLCSHDTEAKLCKWYRGLGREPGFREFVNETHKLAKDTSLNITSRWKSNYKNRHSKCWQAWPPAAPPNVPYPIPNHPVQLTTYNVGCTVNYYGGPPMGPYGAPQDQSPRLQAPVQPQQGPTTQSPHQLEINPGSRADTQAFSSRGSHPAPTVAPTDGYPVPKSADQVIQPELAMQSETQETQETVSPSHLIRSTEETSTWTNSSSPSDVEHTKNFQRVTQIRDTFEWYENSDRLRSSQELQDFSRDFSALTPVLQLLSASNELPFSEDDEASLLEAKRAGRPAVIMKSVADAPEETADRMISGIYSKYKGKEKASMYEPGKDGMPGVKPSEVPRLFQNRQTHKATLTGCKERSLSSDGHDAENPFTPPIKCLNGQGQDVLPMPRCLNDGRYDFLHKVQLQMDSSPRAERDGKKAISRKANRWIQDLSFLLVSMEDSISPWHTDRHALHTLILPQVGEKLWIMLSFTNNEAGFSARLRFQRDGVDFDVEQAINGGGCSLWWTIVGPETCLIMFDSVPHFVYTLSDCVCKGKSFIDAGEMKHWLKGFRREYKYNAFAKATNEDPADGLTEALKAMKEMVRGYALRAYGVCKEDETAVVDHLDRATRAVEKQVTPEQQLGSVSDSEPDSELEGCEGRRFRITSNSVEFVKGGGEEMGRLGQRKRKR